MLNFSASGLSLLKQGVFFFFFLCGFSAQCAKMCRQCKFVASYLEIPGGEFYAATLCHTR